LYPSVKFLPLRQTNQPIDHALLIVGIEILILLLLISKFKPNAFFALLITSFAVGLLSRMNLMDIPDSFLKGIGETMGEIVLIRGCH
jgi:H+/gluconate symporter-like permease